MSVQSANNKRIAKNTLMLYMRMFIMMGVSLYTSRIVLQKLGVDDFGLYNVVGGIVVLFSVLNNSLAGSTQRFLNFELGRSNSEDVSRVFQCSLTLHLILCGVILLLSETIGLWYVNDVLNVPFGRVNATHIVYQFSVITLSVNVLRVPFNACIIAHERMSFYAYVSIIEALLKLLIVYLLSVSPFDKLVFYAFLVLIVTAIITASYVVYCSIAFKLIRIKLCWDVMKIKSMLSFSVWSLFGSTATVSSHQGINLSLNYFCGVGINAAAGIANQVTSAMYGFISNFQTAFNPQIVKLYAQREKYDFFKLIFRASKISFLLFWVVSVPMLYSAPLILELWLNEVPPHTVSFCRIIIVYLLIDALNGPLWTAVNATGMIRNYQITISAIILSNVPLAILLLWLDFAPEIVWYSKIVFNLLSTVARLLYIRKIVSFPVLDYSKRVIKPIIQVVIVTITVWVLIKELDGFNIETGIGHICYTILLTFFSILISFWVGLNRQERQYVLNYGKKCF